MEKIYIYLITLTILLIFQTISISIIHYIDVKYFMDDVEIPDSNDIETFCRLNDFKTGWLSSSACGRNEVQCYKKIIGLEKYECIKWQIN